IIHITFLHRDLRSFPTRRSSDLGPAALLLNLSTMLLGYGLAKWLLKHENQARTICLEVGLQNGTLALLITTGILQSSAMSIAPRSEEHTSELQSRENLVCRLLLE